MIVQMMACIISVVYLTTAPLLPTFNGTIPTTLIIPSALAAGVGFVCNIFIFPTSTASEMIDGMRQVLSPMPDFLNACLLGFKHPGLHMDPEVLMGTRLKVVAAYKALQPSALFLPLDVSVGRWSSEDISSINKPLRQVVIGFTSLVQVQRAKELHKEQDSEAVKMAEAAYEDSGADRSATTPGHHQMGRLVDFRLKSRHPSGEILLEKSLKGLFHSSEKLLDSCRECLKAIDEGLLQSNSLSKSINAEEMIKNHRRALEELQSHRGTFVELTAKHLLGLHSHLFDDDGFLKMEPGQPLPLSGLMFGMLFEDRLLQLSSSLDKLLTRIVELESTRSNVRLWLPKRIMGLLGWISAPETSENPMPAADMGDQNPELPSLVVEKAGSEADTTKSAAAQRNAMKTNNGRKRGKFSHILLGFTHWIGCTEGIFALRVLIVTIAISIPAVVKSSAGFYYREKGMWAVIMAQLATAPYTADLVYGILVRTVGTIVGGVVGMVAWYIGAGTGPGNPYGMAAIMAVVIVVFMWWRLFSPPALMPAGIMMAATAYLVVVYSWMDSHTPTYGSIGIGYTIFWRRLALVFVGFAATIIVNFLPRPPSANRHYRRLLADNLASVRDRYALFVSNWMDPAPDLREVAEQEALTVGEALLSIAGPIKLTMFEFSTSNFDAETLSSVCQLCMILNQSVTYLLMYVAYLPTEDKAKIIPATGATNRDIVAELMSVLSLVQQALKSGDPLPAVLPTPLFTRSIAFARRQVSEASMGTDGLFVRDNVGAERLRNYVVVLHAYVQLLGAVDELVLVVKRAVGETSDMVFPEQV
jgi:hypothetical protein